MRRLRLSAGSGCSACWALGELRRLAERPGAGPRATGGRGRGASGHASRPRARAGRASATGVCFAQRIVCATVSAPRARPLPDRLRERLRRRPPRRPERCKPRRERRRQTMGASVARRAASERRPPTGAKFRHSPDQHFATAAAAAAQMRPSEAASRSNSLSGAPVLQPTRRRNHSYWIHIQSRQHQHQHHLQH